MESQQFCIGFGHLQSKDNLELRKYEERVKVNRIKLRKMLLTITDHVENKSEAQIFFEEITSFTGTFIECLQTFAIPTKSRNRSYIRITGYRLKDVMAAKELVLKELQPSNEFLRLKIVLSSVEHTYIHGRNLININRIMDDTQTEILFPDNSLTKRENCVYAYGDLEGLKRARVQLRLSAPLTMSFEYAKTTTIPFVASIGAHYKVQTIFSTSTKPNTSVLYIRGPVRRAHEVKEATRALLESTFGNAANNMLVNVQVEIPLQYHDCIKGEDSLNIKNIMKETETIITFPDHYQSMQSNKKSLVTITGSIENVFVAREKLIDCLPIEFTFDMPDKNGAATEMMNLAKNSGLSLTISQKNREFKMTATIKGTEKVMDKIYEVHSKIVLMSSDLEGNDDNFDGWKNGNSVENLAEGHFTDSGHSSRASLGSQHSTGSEHSLWNHQIQYLYPPKYPMFMNQFPQMTVECNMPSPTYHNGQFYGSSCVESGPTGVEYNVPSPTYHNGQFYGSSGVESGPTGYSVNSPLIVGSSESVAQKLVCTGWGLF